MAEKKSRFAGRKLRHEKPQKGSNGRSRMAPPTNDERGTRGPRKPEDLSRPISLDPREWDGTFNDPNYDPRRDPRNRGPRGGMPGRRPLPPGYVGTPEDWAPSRGPRPPRGKDGRLPPGYGDPNGPIVIDDPRGPGVPPIGQLPRGGYLPGMIQRFNPLQERLAMLAQRSIRSSPPVPPALRRGNGVPSYGPPSYRQPRQKTDNSA